MGLSHCRPGRDRSVHPCLRVRICNVKLRSSSPPGSVNGSLSCQKEFLGLKSEEGNRVTLTSRRPLPVLAD
jgi:hypothetical protein